MADEYQFPIQLGRYTLLELIGSGGMGEVFLAHDPVCDRRVALKRITPKRKGKEKTRIRFKKEVRIPARLAHPAIIPIYDLCESEEELYYTMPFLEGETLQMILLKARLADQQGLPPTVMGHSIPSLMLVFLNICQGVEYTHSKGFIHRDLKPGNIIIGKHNEVTILDWGVATEIYDPEEEKGEGKSPEGQTNPRGAAGTIEYMAPERAFKEPASIKTDIYSLGVILHFMLTLQVPYKRPDTIKGWREGLLKKGVEPRIDPQEVAPYRDITQQLCRIVHRSLHPNPDKRFDSVGEIINELQLYIQGEPDWVPAETFNIHKEEDWEFQETVMLTKQMAISRYAGVMEWILLTLSKESYSGNIQVKTKVQIEEKGGGIGILMCVPENSGRESLEKGYLLWVGSKENPGAKLFRDNIEVSRIDEMFLEPEVPYTIAAQRQDNQIILTINGEQKLSYASHVPLVGGHFGIVSKDTEFEISPIELSTGSQNVLINCLSIPDAFLLNKDYERAITEYRRIAYSFKGRPEGREAIFRAGYAFTQEGDFENALSEFERLHKGPGEPLEYLGKSLVYQAENNLEEEIKCLELAIRKFPKHPLRHVLEEHILFRLHETAQKHRIGAYAFALLALRHVPRICHLAETKRLIKNLTIGWEELPFMQPLPSNANEKEEEIHTAINLAFWLARPTSLYELAHPLPQEYKHRLLLLENALRALHELGYPKLIDFIRSTKYPKEESLNVEVSLPPAWEYLLKGDAKKGAKELKNKPIEDPSSIYFMLQGCYLALTEGEEKALAHFKELLEVPFPSTPTLLGHFLKGHLDPWMKNAFVWEKVQLYKQLSLYYFCLGNKEKGSHHEACAKEILDNAQVSLNFV